MSANQSGINFIGMRTTRPGDRLFEPINDLHIILSAIGHAASLMIDGRTHKESHPSMRVSTRQYDYAFVLSLRGPLEHALNNTIPEFIDIGMTRDTDPITGKLQTQGLSGVMTHVISPLFLTFFERYNEWLTDNLGDAANWHPTLNFCRVVRNAAAHGSVHFRNPRAPAVSWRGLSYGPTDNGRKVIGDDLRFGDIIGLMIEADDQLTAMGAPVL